MTFKTWVDLRGLADIDAVEVQALVTRGAMRQELGLDRHTLIAVLECAAAAQDRTIQQERALRDQLALLR